MNACSTACCSAVLRTHGGTSSGLAIESVTEYGMFTRIPTEPPPASQLTASASPFGKACPVPNACPAAGGANAHINTTAAVIPGFLMIHLTPLARSPPSQDPAREQKAAQHPGLLFAVEQLEAREQRPPFVFQHPLETLLNAALASFFDGLGAARQGVSNRLVGPPGSVHIGQENRSAAHFWLLPLSNAINIRNTAMDARKIPVRVLVAAAACPTPNGTLRGRPEGRYLCIDDTCADYIGRLACLSTVSLLAEPRAGRDSKLGRSLAPRPQTGAQAVGTTPRSAGAARATGGGSPSTARRS